MKRNQNDLKNSGTIFFTKEWLQWQQEGIEQGKRMHALMNSLTEEQAHQEAMEQAVKISKQRQERKNHEK